MQLGSLAIDQVLDGVGRFAPTKTYRGTTPEQWAAHRNLLDPDGLLPMAFGSFLIRSGDRRALVDLGVGPRTFLGIEGGHLLENLEHHGVRAEEITDVLFTHLHGDHTGWATRDGEATFPDATYRCSEADWQHFMVDHPGNEADRLRPIASRFEPWATDATILPGLDVTAAPGHTPGSSLIVLSSGSDRAMLLGDVIHCPAELVDSEWGGIADVDPGLAARTRESLAREIEGTQTLVASAHFNGLQFGRLLLAEGRRRWVM